MGNTPTNAGVRRLGLVLGTISAAVSFVVVGVFFVSGVGESQENSSWLRPHEQDSIREWDDTYSPEAIRRREATLIDSIRVVARWPKPRGMDLRAMSL